MGSSQLRPDPLPLRGMATTREETPIKCMEWVPEQQQQPQQPHTSVGSVPILKGSSGLIQQHIWHRSSLYFPHFWAFLGILHTVVWLSSSIMFISIFGPVNSLRNLAGDHLISFELFLSILDLKLHSSDTFHWTPCSNINHRTTAQNANGRVREKGRTKDVCSSYSSVGKKKGQ